MSNKTLIRLEPKLLSRSMSAVLPRTRQVDVVWTPHIGNSIGATEVNDRDDLSGKDAVPELLVDHRQVLESLHEREEGVDRAFDRKELGSSAAASGTVLVMMVFTIVGDTIDDGIDDVGRNVVEPPLGGRKFTSQSTPVRPVTGYFQGVVMEVLDMAVGALYVVCLAVTVSHPATGLREPLPRMTSLHHHVRVTLLGFRDRASDRLFFCMMSGMRGYDQSRSDGSRVRLDSSRLTSKNCRKNRWGIDQITEQ